MTLGYDNDTTPDGKDYLKICAIITTIIYVGLIIWFIM